MRAEVKVRLKSLRWYISVQEVVAPDAASSSM